MSNRTFVMACLTPLFIFSLAFLALPLIRLFLASGEGDAGWADLSRYRAQAALLEHTGSDRACVTGDNICSFGRVHHRGHVPCAQPSSKVAEVFWPF